MSWKRSHRQRGGFKADQVLNREFKQKGISSEGLHRHQKVLSAVEGKRVSHGKGGGHHHYMRAGPFARFAASVAAGAAGGVPAGLAVGAASSLYQNGVTRNLGLGSDRVPCAV